MNGWVYAAFASHCDNASYAGYVAGVDVESTPVTTTLWTDEAGVSERQGRHLAERRRADVRRGRADLLHLGQRHLPGQGPGQQAPGPARRVHGPAGTEPDHRGADREGLLQPGERAQARRGRQGLRFRRPGRAPVRHERPSRTIVAQAGKYGRIYLLNRNNLGGRQQNSVGGDEDLFEIGHLAGLWGSPGVFGDTTTLTAGNAAKCQRLPDTTSARATTCARSRSGSTAAASRP